ncbi:MAG: YlxR family protein [Candidatus Tectomicrobia bacterium]|nr:YlxR family protein [Candidatus Tectomicrobia bacterium]
MPVRTCIGCRTKGEADAFFRMVAGPGGGVAAELGNRLPGRGAHCCFKSACLESALKPKNLARALRAEVRPAELAGRVRALLRQRLEVLALRDASLAAALAQRAGQFRALGAG